jgi:serine/threonine-protein kinase
MSLPAGTRFGPYEVLGAIGAGGMGEVYQARDTKLQRVVALKTLPPALAADPDRVARFRREALVLASLNHPNIAAIYGFEDSGGSSALVMEFVPGKTLDEVIGHAGASGERGHSATEARRSGLGIREALEIARQVAVALEAAYEQSVVHRDLKPANVKITDDGRVKVLDFGLAKAITADGALTTPDSTVTGTEIGLVLGTPAYMSPEQAKGRPVDRRTDIWSLGVILFEMLAGRALYRGETVTETIAHVITQPPDWSALPPATPPALRRLLRRCLEKDPKNRLQSAGDLRLEIEEMLAERADDSSPATANAAPAPTPAWRRFLPWSLAAILLAALIVVLWPKATPPTHVARLDLQLAEALTVDDNIDGAVAIVSPDGQSLVYLGERDRVRRLYYRPLDRLEGTPIPGTENAVQPFFSPDSKSVAFFTNGRMNRAALAGGAPVTIAPVANPRGGAWSADDTIVFSGAASTGLWKVPASGGTPVELTKLLANERTHRWPSVLPGGNAVLFICQRNEDAYDDASIEAARIDTGERTVLVNGGTSPLYVPGHLVFVRKNSLFAVRFDPATLKTSGAPVMVLSDVMSTGGGVGASSGNGASQFSIASNGTAVYVSGSTSGIDTSLQLAIVDRNGKADYTYSERARFTDVRFSPDGQRIALRLGDRQGDQIHVFDIARETLTKLTFDGSFSGVPVWSPDGKQIAFMSERRAPGLLDLFIVNSDGTGEVKALASTGVPRVPMSFSPTGDVLAVSEINPATNMDILFVSVADGKATPFLTTPAIEVGGVFSPDGKWILYQYLEPTGIPAVFVRAVPGGGSLRQVSAGLGVLPYWTKKGAEIIYAMPTPRGATFFAVSVEPAGAALELGKPQELFTLPIATPDNSGWYHVSEDGTRFVVGLVDTSTNALERRHLTLVFNFLDEIRRAVAGGK